MTVAVEVAVGVAVTVAVTVGAVCGAVVLPQAAALTTNAEHTRCNFIDHPPEISGAISAPRASIGRGWSGVTGSSMGPRAPGSASGRPMSRQHLPNPSIELQRQSAIAFGVASRGTDCGEWPLPDVDAATEPWLGMPMGRRR